MNTTPVVTIFIASIFTNNILLANFLGLCSFLVCSNKIETAAGLGAAVTFVMVCTTAINYLLYYYVLRPLQLGFLSYIISLLLLPLLFSL